MESEESRTIVPEPDLIHIHEGFVSQATPFNPDQVDSKGFSIFKTDKNVKSSSPPAKVHVVDFDVTSEYYDMTNTRRGNAIILNHMKFDRMNERKGTELDAKRVQQNLMKLGFETFTYHDLDKSKLLDTLQKASEDDYTNHDCLVIVVMTHGDVGVLWAKDKSYKVSELWEPFTSSACPSLLGKPKLIFIQACRGDSLDHGVQIQPRTFRVLIDSVDSAAKDIVYTIPAMADLLVMYSTFEGHYSWRSPSQGSWYMQALCDELDENGDTRDLLTLLTGVSRRVAFGYQSNVPHDNKMDAKKQIPSIVSMLTKTLYFTKKRGVQKSENK